MLDSPEYRAKLRQLLADISGEALPDYVDPAATPTRPSYDKPKDAKDLGKNLKTTVHLGSSLLGSIGARNPALFAEAAAKQLISKGFNPLQKKQAALHEYSSGFETGQKMASDVRNRSLDVIAKEPPVSVCILALRNIFGEEFYGWEPETIFWELEDYGVQVSDRLKDKINCGLCLCAQPAFLNDVRVFENCVRVMNDLETDVNIVQKPDIPYICAAIYEASMLMEREQKLPDDMEFVDDIDSYVGAALFHDNYMRAPAELCFASHVLDKYNENADVVLPALKKGWEEYQEGLIKGEPRGLEENLLDVQISKLAGCWLYTKERMREIENFTDQVSG